MALRAHLWSWLRVTAYILLTYICSMHNRKFLRFLAQVGYFYAVLAIPIMQIQRDWIKTSYRGKRFSCFCMRTASTPKTHWCVQMCIYMFLDASVYNRPPCPLFIPLRARAFWSSTESISKSFSRLSLRQMQKEESIKVRLTNRMQKQNKKYSADDSQKAHTPFHFLPSISSLRTYFVSPDRVR